MNTPLKMVAALLIGSFLMGNGFANELEKKGGATEEKKEAAAPINSVSKKPALPSLGEFLKNIQKEEPGLITLVQKENKWFAVFSKEQLNVPLWFSVNVKKGVGSAWLYSQSPGPAWLTYFRMRPNNMVQLAVISDVLVEDVKKNGTNKIVQESDSFTEGLLWTGQVIAEDEKRFAVEVTGLLFADHAKFAERLESHQKTSYGLDVRSSSLFSIEQHPKESVWEVEQHWYAPKMSLQSIPLEGAAVSNSLLPVLRLSFMALPEKAMSPRIAGEGVGFFKSEFYEKHTVDTPPWRSWIHRWRLEPQEEKTEEGLLSAKESIPVYVCPNVPSAYHGSIERAVGQWNGAFEKAGWRAPLTLSYLKENQMLPLGQRRLLVCWYWAYGGNSAFGPSKVDPRSGEILEARVLIPDVFIKTAHEYVQQELLERHKFAALEEELESALLELRVHTEAQIPLDYPPEGKALIEAYIEHIVAHEMGHALGLRHNFKATSSIAPEMLEHSAHLSESVMDYVPMNVFAKQWEHKVMKGLGAYDLWAIEYGYRWFEKEEEEKQALRELIAKAKEEPALAYASDEHLAEKGLPIAGVKRFDLSNSPIAFAQKRIERLDEKLSVLQNTKKQVPLIEIRKLLEESLGVQALAQESVLSLMGATKKVSWGNLVLPKEEESLPLFERQEQRAALRWLESSLIHPKRVFKVDAALLRAMSLRRTIEQRTAGSNVMYYEQRNQKLKEYWINPFLSMQMILNIKEAYDLSQGRTLSVQEYLNIGTMILFAPKSLAEEHLAGARARWIEQLFARAEEASRGGNGLEPLYLENIRKVRQMIGKRGALSAQEHHYLNDKLKQLHAERSATKK